MSGPTSSSGLVYYTRIYVFVAEFPGAAGACSRVDMTDTVTSLIDVAVIFRLRSCTKELEGKNSSTYVYTIL